MMANWTDARALLVRAAGAAGARVDPIFGRPLTFYLFTLPAWQLVAGWLMTLAVIVVRDRGRSSSRSPAARALIGGRRDAGAGAAVARAVDRVRGRCC